MNYDELVADLRYCADTETSCSECRRMGTVTCEVNLHTEAADAIEGLQKDLERSKEYEAFWEKEATEALRRFQVAIASKPRWISVKERLPEKPGIYAVWTAKGFGNHLSTSNWDGESWSLRVTHWMPLPTPPKEDADAV